MGVVEGLMASAAFWIFTPAGFQKVLHPWFVHKKLTHGRCIQSQLDHWCVIVYIVFVLFQHSKVAYLTSFCFIVKDLVWEGGVIQTLCRFVGFPKRRR